MSTNSEQQNPIALATEIISAYVGNNTVPHESLPDLIKKVHQTVREEARENGEPKPEASAKATPAQIRKSVTAEHLLSFVDGKPYKTLKRHLGTHGLDPYSYRQRYGLPNDYPMVAPNYAAQRSALAKSIGLGRPGGRIEEEAPAPEPATKSRSRQKVA